MRKGPWRWCWRRGGPGRPPKPRIIGSTIKAQVFIPLDKFNNVIEGEPINLLPDELEALRLVYLEKKTQEEAARLMGFSRGSLWRCLDSGRTKLVKAIVESRPLILIS
ncbi:MAG: hypothetical protein DRJ30_05545 [Candidatus Methanomethylicota archaeon]|nr:MAG: hypothetical protein DRJ30_05545 [Candidatus Verstraetearchaeota archaeon]